MKQSGIITNQKVTNRKIKVARDLRQNMTKAESAFWEMVRDRKFFNLKFRRQQIIDGLIADFYCNELGLVIEIDGCIHQNHIQKMIDRERDEIFKSIKLEIIRFSNDDVLTRPDYIIEKMKMILNKSK
jgi:very-short-patch-repair endonuclease